MRIFYSIPLLALVLAQVIYLPGLSLWLEWNRSKIAEKFCINVDKPELMCSGRCFISGQMYEALDETSDEKAPGPVHQDKQSPAFQFILPQVILKGLALSTCHNSGQFYFRNEASGVFPRDIFRPPPAASFSFFLS